MHIHSSFSLFHIVPSVLLLHFVIYPRESARMVYRSDGCYQDRQHGFWLRSGGLGKYTYEVKGGGGQNRMTRLLLVSLITPY